MKIRGVRRLAAVLTLTATSMVLVATTPAAPARAASDQPPVAVDDTVQVYPGDDRLVDVVRNDTDPDNPSTLQVCRVGTPSSRHLLVASGEDAFFEFGRRSPTAAPGSVALLVDPLAPPGSYTVRYQVCDTDYLVPATLTIQVIRLPHVRVAKLPDRPGHLRVTNPSDFTALFAWMAAGPDLVKIDGMVRIAPHRSTVIAVTRHRIQWISASAGHVHHFLGTGTVGHIRLRPGQRAASARRPIPSLAGVFSRYLHPSPVDRAARQGDDGPWPPSTFLPVDPATTVAPTAAPDRMSVWAGVSVFNPLRNDTDPAGGRMDICRVDVADPRLEVVVAGTTLLVDTSRARAGVHTFTYYACNAHRLAAATVTLTVRRAKPLVVRIVKGHPSQVRVHNPNPVAAAIAIGDFATDPSSISVSRIRPGHTRWVPVHNRYAFWFGMIKPGGMAGHGKLRNVPLTAADARKDKSRASDLRVPGLGSVATDPPSLPARVRAELRRIAAAR